MRNEPLLDLDTLETLRALQPDGAGDIISELCDMFRKTAPPLIEKMRLAAAQGDSDALYQSAHALKGNSAALGAVTLATRAKEIELMGRMKNLHDATTQVTLAEQEFTRTLAALEQQCVR